MKYPGNLIAIILLGIVSLVHLGRLVLGVEMIIGGWLVPQWISFPGFVVPAIIVVILWRERNLR